jgi:phage FluMu protein Com
MGRKLSILVNGMSLYQLAEELGVSYHCLYARYRSKGAEKVAIAGHIRRGRPKKLNETKIVESREQKETKESKSKQAKSAKERHALVPNDHHEKENKKEQPSKRSSKEPIPEESPAGMNVSEEDKWKYETVGIFNVKCPHCSTVYNVDSLALKDVLKVKKSTARKLLNDELLFEYFRENGCPSCLKKPAVSP